MLQPIRRLLDRPQCFRLGRTSPVGTFTRGFDVPWQGTHNNLAERTLRPAAIGRKNWLFAGNDQGGHTAAVLFTMIASAKACGVDPFAWLRDVLARLPALIAAQPAAPNVTDLLPDHWRQAHPNAHLPTNRQA